MKLFMINENGMQEFIPTSQTDSNKENTFSFFDELKNSLIEHQEPTKTGIKLVTINKLIKIFETTRPTIYSWIDLGLLKPIKIGGRVYFNEDDLQELINQKTSENN